MISGSPRESDRIKIISRSLRESDSIKMISGSPRESDRIKVISRSLRESDRLIISSNILQLIFLGNIVWNIISEFYLIGNNNNWWSLIAFLNIYPTTREKITQGDLQLLSGFYLSTAFFVGGWSVLLNIPFLIKLSQVCLGLGLAYICIVFLVSTSLTWYPPRKPIRKKKIY